MVLTLVPEAAVFPKLFCDLTPKVSNNAFNSSNFIDFILHKTINDPRGVKGILVPC